MHGVQQGHFVSVREAQEHVLTPEGQDSRRSREQRALGLVGSACTAHHKEPLVFVFDRDYIPARGKHERVLYV